MTPSSLKRGIHPALIRGIHFCFKKGRVPGYGSGYAGHSNRPGGSGVMASPQICIVFESRLFCAEQASSVLQTLPSIQGIRITISPEMEEEAEEYAAAAQ